jgi:hypothetical protein
MPIPQLEAQILRHRQLCCAQSPMVLILASFNIAEQR